jgi:valyl-tRNA synthetase
VKVEDRLIDLAHSDRSKTPIEPYLADQWFVKMDQLAQSAMDAVQDGRVRILPVTLYQGLPRLAGRKARLARQPAAVVGHQIPVWSMTRNFEKICRLAAAAGSAGFGDVEGLIPPMIRRIWRSR